MTLNVHRVDARHTDLWFANDPELALPRQPRLIPELMVVPLGTDGLLIAGAEEPQVFRGRDARGLLLRLLPLLDGRRTVGEIARCDPRLSQAQVRQVVSLLHSRGLLEDGDSPDLPPELADVGSFVGRLVDVSRRYPNRAAALSRLATVTVAVIGPEPLTAQIMADLRSSGVGRIRSGTDATDPPTLTIAVSTGARPETASEHAPAPGAEMVLVRLGRDEAHIGPHLIGGVTACPGCVARAHPHPAGEPDALVASFWTALATHFAFLALTWLPPGLTLRGFRVQRYRDGGITEDTRLAVRLPGCATCGMRGRPWEPTDPRMISWIYHSATSLPARELLSPKDHQAHYLAEFAHLATRERRLLWSAASADLTSGGLSTTAIPQARTGRRGDADACLDSSTLAEILARSAGEITEGGRRRRLVPTGGNLGSVVLWVIARQVTGLEPGAYLYDPHRHALDLVGRVDDERLRTALPCAGPLPDCVLIGAGALAKCAQKYRSFAYRLVHLDAGIALAYLHLVTADREVGLQEYPDLDLGVTELFGVPRRWEFPHTIFAAGLGRRPARHPSTAVPPSPPTVVTPRPLGPADYTFDVLTSMLDRMPASPPIPTDLTGRDLLPVTPVPRSVPDLERAMLERRAVRDFADRPVPAHVLGSVVAAAIAARTRRLRAGSPECFVRPLVAVARDTGTVPAGLYEAGPEPGDLVWRADFTMVQALDCTNQRALARAPAAVVMVADLPAAVSRRGTRGYAELAVYAGAMVGEAWLSAVSAGLVGTAAGGVISGGLRAVDGIDGFVECPMLALYLGYPAEGGAP